ncbi:phage protein NinX family protein [Paraburkholderia sp. C35]|uniref:phage protein NinX family protein n=1 Tax=Paraburkholderia sp. C35 TaxID=2126993 RepID=UPI000D685CED|nr:phage protein NinX family protein [Paraburkholderia sp. C35]
MKRLKVSDLSGPQLDYWVARADGIERAVILSRPNDDPFSGCFAPSFAFEHEVLPDLDPSVDFEDRKPDDYMNYNPSIDWRVGGPILEREGLSIECKKKRDGTMKYRCPQWTDKWSETYLLAGMRAFVGLKFGNWVSPQKMADGI